MLESAWLFTGLLAIIATTACVLTTDDGIAIISGVLGFIAWGVWTFGTLGVEAVGDSTTFTFSMPSVTLLGVAFAMVPAYIALTGPVEIIGRYREPSQREV